MTLVMFTLFWSLIYVAENKLELVLPVTALILLVLISYVIYTT